MEFQEITAEQFRAYAAQSPYQSFMQTPEIAALRAKNGWAPAYAAVADAKGKLLAATMLVGKATFLGKYQTFYLPGGPLLDLENRALTKFFCDQLRAYARARHGFVLHIAPYYELIERDRHGAAVPGGFNHEEALTNLRQLGFQPLANTTMPRYLFALDFQGRSEEELFQNFKSNTRGHIRHAEKAGVRVRELKRKELGVLKQITKATAARRGFEDQPLSYYEQMFDLFHPRGEVRFLVAEAEIDGVLTPLSAAMFMLVGREVVYLYSGSDEKFMKSHNAQYAIQWEMIRFAVRHGFQRYNFYGIAGLPNEMTEEDGVYNFKKGFGGQVIELIGSFELPVNPKIYRLHRTLSRTKEKLQS